METCEEMQEYNNRGLKGCRKWSSYQKLESGDRRKRRGTIRLGGGWRRRLWRVKVSPRLKILQAVSPKRLFAPIHKAYVRTMLGFADKLWFSYGGSEFGGIVRRPLEKEYDDPLILQVQKMLLERNHRLAGEFD